ncbi:MAG: CRISPR-associated endonuclease Cas2 [Ferroplasma acidiphilum]|nr:CRISPR-associated endonuclease Cas2 [Ferroplasma acidiphilum]WMT53076.1 MAG: CRISPR-associated endonuclease Cas2 [Ferroplasma acidiphilum]
MVYDVSEKRVFKVLKIARKYITWIQNSVLEGEISMANYEKLKIEIKKVIKPEEDSILFYIIRDLKYTSKENIGIIKNSDEKFF